MGAILVALPKISANKRAKDGWHIVALPTQLEEYQGLGMLQVVHNGNTYFCRCSSSVRLLTDPEVPSNYQPPPNYHPDLRAKEMPCGSLAQLYRVGVTIPNFPSKVVDADGWITTMSINKDGELELVKVANPPESRPELFAEFYQINEVDAPAAPKK